MYVKTFNMRCNSSTFLLCERNFSNRYSCKLLKICVCLSLISQSGCKEPHVNDDFNNDWVSALKYLGINETTPMPTILNQHRDKLRFQIEPSYKSCAGASFDLQPNEKSLIKLNPLYRDDLLTFTAHEAYHFDLNNIGFPSGQVTLKVGYPNLFYKEAFHERLFYLMLKISEQAHHLIFSENLINEQLFTDFWKSNFVRCSTKDFFLLENFVINVVSAYATPRNNKDQLKSFYNVLKKIKRELPRDNEDTYKMYLRVLSFSKQLVHHIHSSYNSSMLKELTN